MAGKKKKGKKKEKKTGEATDKLAAVDRTFYELTITDLNTKLARLRSHNAKIEETNEELTEKLRKLEEDRTDITAYLDRNLNEKKDVIREMSEQLIELSKVREEEAKEASNKIKEWEVKFKAMQEQLSSEIKLLNGKLNSLEEFRIHKDELSAKFDHQESLLRRHQNAHQDIIYEMERKAILDKAQLKKDAQVRLFKLSDDFHKSGEIRMAAYTQRLIRENIALNNEMNKMIQTQMRIEEDHKQMKRKSHEIRQQHENDEAIKDRLIRTCQNQVQIIERMAAEFEVLKTKYGKTKQYRKLYEDSLKRDTCERFKINDMEKKIVVMRQRLDTLKIEKAKLIHLHQSYEAEVLRLQGIIKHIKFTVQSAIRSEEEPTQCKEYRKAQRQGLLTEIIQIITTYSDAGKIPSISTISTFSQMYQTGSAGMLPRSTSLLQLFKREARKIASAEVLSPEMGLKKSDSKIIPPSRRLPAETLFDVESGSTFVVSSVHGETEEEIEEDMDEGEDEYKSSSSSQQNINAQKSKIDASKEAG